jgi:outer membrane protein OmpA-like peptidoglycan-associated protein
VVNDSIIERFRLIFFDFDAPTVSAFNSSMVDLVRSRIRTTSSVRITGLTDRLGPVERNQGLSLARAQSIDASIKQRIVPERVSVKGAGPELIYNNDLPEGRLYNRTVLIEVATPVDSE